MQLQHCTYQRKTLLFALIKVSTFVCKREISGLSSPLKEPRSIDYRIWYLKLDTDDFSVCVEVNLKNRFHLSSSSRRPKHVKMSTLALLTERGRCWLIHSDLKLFVLFVLHKQFFCFEGRRRCRCRQIVRSLCRLFIFKNSSDRILLVFSQLLSGGKKLTATVLTL